MKKCFFTYIRIRAAELKATEIELYVICCCGNMVQDICVRMKRLWDFMENPSNKHWEY